MTYFGSQTQELSFQLQPLDCKYLIMEYSRKKCYVDWTSLNHDWIWMLFRSILSHIKLNNVKSCHGNGSWAVLQHDLPLFTIFVEYTEHLAREHEGCSQRCQFKFWGSTVYVLQQSTNNTVESPTPWRTSTMIMWPLQRTKETHAFYAFFFAMFLPIQ